MNVPEMIDKIFTSGPDRVVINENGEATTSQRAIEQHRITPDIIFIRFDGWSLAAPESLESVAYKLWKDDWTHFVRRPSMTPLPIREYPTK
jgi:hypothetical protein